MNQCFLLKCKVHTAQRSCKLSDPHFLPCNRNTCQHEIQAKYVQFLPQSKLLRHKMKSTFSILCTSATKDVWQLKKMKIISLHHISPSPPWSFPLSFGTYLIIEVFFFQEHEQPLAWKISECGILHTVSFTLKKKKKGHFYSLLYLINICATIWLVFELAK